MADRVVLMRGGRIEQNDPPAALYARPATSFAARFIGTPPMNLLALADAPDGAGAIIRGSAGPAILPGRGEGLTAGIRPEAVALTGADGVPAEILASEYLGADTVLACRIGDETLSVRAAGQLSHAPGDRINLALPATALHLFDARTGLRVAR